MGDEVAAVARGTALSLGAAGRRSPLHWTPDHQKKRGAAEQPDAADERPNVRSAGRSLLIWVLGGHEDAMRISARHRAVWAMLVFMGAIASAPAFRPVGPPYATLLWKLFWVGLCFLGLAVMYRMRPDEALAELGLRGSVRAGLAIGLIASLPMLLVLATTSPLNPDLALVPLLSTGVLSPVTEEVLFRGYLFLQLYRRAGWAAPTAVITTGLLFGLAHVGSLPAAGKAFALLGEVGMIAAGGAFYAWLLVRWQDNLWVPIGTHGFMNLSCEVFGCDQRPGTWLINLGRVLAVVTAVALTVNYQHRSASVASRPTTR